MDCLSAVHGGKVHFVVHFVSFVPGRRVARFLDRHLVLVVGLGVVGLLYGLFLYQSAEIEITVETPEEVALQMYWAGPGQNFSESRTSGAVLPAGQSTVVVRGGRVREGTRFRLDPLREEGEVRLLEVRVRQRLARDWIAPLSGEEGPTVAGTAEVTPDGPPGLLLRSTGEDPQLWWDRVERGPEAPGGGRAWRQGATDLLVLFLLAAFLRFLERKVPALDRVFLRRLYFVPAVLLVVSGGVYAIAIGSAHGNHPDEPVHAPAGHYYTEHWILPQADDPAIANSYSPYGFSRLNSPEIAYWVGGKWAGLLTDSALTAPVERLRFFNASLFLALALVSLLHLRFRLLLLPLLLTPQLWYLFAYYNSDAFALAACYGALFLTVHPRGWVERLRAPDAGALRVAACVAVACLLGVVLALLKQNYWVFGGFLGGYLLVRAAFAGGFFGRRLAVAVLLAAVAGFSAPELWKGAFHLRNGMPHEEATAQMQRAMADPEFQPDVDPERSFAGLDLRGKGFSLEEMFTVFRWHDLIVMNSFGNYRWFDTHPELFFVYRMFKVAAVAFLLFLVPAVFFVRWEDGLVVAGGLFTMAALLGAALWFAWTSDFQVQGRYLAPLVPVLGVLGLTLRRRILWPALGIFLAASTLLGLYSFFFFAMPEA